MTSLKTFFMSVVYNYFTSFMHIIISFAISWCSKVLAWSIHTCVFLIFTEWPVPLLCLPMIIFCLPQDPLCPWSFPLNWLDLLCFHFHYHFSLGFLQYFYLFNSISVSRMEYFILLFAFSWKILIFGLFKLRFNHSFWAFHGECYISGFHKGAWQWDW